MSLSKPEAKQGGSTIGFISRSLYGTLRSRQSSIGIVVGEKDKSYLVFKKEWPKFVKEFRKRCTRFKIGDVVEIENSFKIAPITSENILSEWNGEIDLSSPLRFELRNIVLDMDSLKKNEYFEHKVLGKVEDIGRSLEFTAYRTILIEMNEANPEYFWKVVEFDKINEKTVESFIAKKTEEFTSAARSKTTTKQASEDSLFEYFENEAMSEEDQEGDNDPKLQFQGRNLNVAQKRAIRKGLNADCKILMIDGGAGTGKTRVMGELACELVSLQKQVLVLTQTTAARKAFMIALERAHIYRMSDHNSYMDSEKYTGRLDFLFDNLQKLEENRNNEEYAERVEEAVDETKLKIKQLQSLSNVKIVVGQIDEAFVEWAQNRTAFSPTIVIVDEAQQFAEEMLLPKVKKFHRLILAGDSEQLPGYSSRSEKFYRSVLDTFQRKKCYSHHIELRTQYRCPQEIGMCSSSLFYRGDMKTDCTVANNSLIDLLDSSSKIFSIQWDRQTQFSLEQQLRPFVFCDTKLEKNWDRIIEQYEKKVEDGTWINVGEAKIIIAHIKELLANGVDFDDIVVITPFTSQKHLLRILCSDEFPQESRIKIETLHALQGQEMNVVLFSMVRNNPLGKFGLDIFAQYVNFAMTRAKKHFFMVSNSLMLKKGVFVELLNMLNNPEIAAVVRPSLIRGDAEDGEEVVEYFGPNNELFYEICEDEQMKKDMKMPSFRRF